MLYGNLIVYFTIVLSSIELITAFSYEKRLIKELMTNYTRTGLIGRPVKNSTQKLTVEYGLSLIQILDLNEIDQILTIKVWTRFTWVDELLTWDPTQYNDVREIRMPPKKMWLPDVVLFNYADERMAEQRDVMTVVNYDGRVNWMPPAIYKSTCSIDIQSFPFDEQACHLSFGSFTYSGDKLDLQIIANETELNIDNYVPNNEWLILARPARRTIKANFPQIVYFLFLKRHSAFFAYLLVLPCVLLSSLTLVAFWLPYFAPAKILLGINIFSAFFLLLLLLAKSTPSASVSVPYLGYYYSLNMLLITLSTFLAATVTNVFFRSDKRQPMPDWLKEKLLCFSRILCIATEEDLPVSSATLRMGGSKRDRVSSILPSRVNNHKNASESTVSRSAANPPPPPQPPSSTVCTCKCASTTSSDTKAMPRDGLPRNKYFPAGSPSESSKVQCTCQKRCMESGVGQYSVKREVDASSSPPLTKKSNTRGANSANKSTASVSRALETSLLEINNAIRQTMNRLSAKDSKMKKTKEWQLVSLVMDRILFWCFCCFILIAGFVLLTPKSVFGNMEAFIKQHAP